MPQPDASLASLGDEKNAWKHGPPLPEGWQETLIGHLEAKGTYALACKRTGVSDETVRKYRHADPAFDARCRWAREIFADTVEEKLLDIGERSDDPVPSIVILKKLRPAEYIEKHAIMSINLTGTLGEIDGAAVLRAIVGDPGAPTQQLLSSPAPALPAATEPTEDAW